MSSDIDGCREAFEARLESPQGAVRWERHLAGCARCRQESHDLRRLTDLLDENGPPALDSDRLASMEQRLLHQLRHLAAVQPTPAPASRSKRLALIATAALLAVALGGSWLVLRHRGTDSEPGSTPSRAARQAPEPLTPLAIVSTTGRVAHRSVRTDGDSTAHWRLSVGELIETMGARAHATLRATSGELLLRLGSASRLRRLPGKGWRLLLEQGDLVVELVHMNNPTKTPGETLSPSPSRRVTMGQVRLVVETSQGAISVRGTRFRVHATSKGTAVTVLDGVVVYRARRGEERSVSAGRRLEDDGRTLRLSLAQGPPALAPSGPARPATPAPTPPHKDAGARRPRTQCSTARIRRLLAAGRAGAAMKAIASCRSSAVGRSRAALLGTLYAQALLTMGRVTAAAGAYHRVASRHRGSPLAQTALFAAGQIELGRLGQRRRALATFRRYLKRYPSGRYAAEARSLVRSLSRPPRARP